ncbi:MAG: CarD family transcriptional regulator [Candidatus Pacebacteria bacterium]|nr:CarD family transcriptional regulator [Candidatus Paceibacterota bacterium]
MNIIREQALILAIIPYFLERENFWFEKNIKSIKDQAFFKENTILLKKENKYNLSSILNKLSNLGYEKVQKVEQIGEFSHLGGLLYVFPLNSKNILCFEFSANKLEKIKEIPTNIDFKKNKALLIKKIKRQDSFSNLTDLKPNDYLVHLDHGIGIFKEKSIINNNEYYVIEYAKNDKLYVPVNLKRKLSKYIGFSQPKITRLGGYYWEKKKQKIKQKTEKLAKEILLLTQKREKALRPAYLPDDEIMNNVLSSFEYEETPDQIKAWEEIKKDLEKERPIDRIICGDIGFGKTEIALRIMIKVINSGKQAIMICPTTILANQHYNNFKKRLNNLPIKIALLSRLQNKKEQQTIVKNIKNIDIIIATHRIFSKDVFNLVFEKGGVLIIDEEQRFGVKQKEKFKELRTYLDIVSLSATPIPRTLYMALTNLKKISIIQTPPKNRLAIKTFVHSFDKKIIKKAVEKELKRKGQVYYLYNKVKNIEKIKKELEELIPSARFAIIHGKLEEKEMIQIMQDFQNKLIDVLIATTIIENGLDISNVNTLIVANSALLGLSQAYQIKGRVGRSHSQAYAYFLYPKKLTEIAKQRLKVLKQAEELGSGYKIALKDLELRGAGNIIGKEQSGTINQVGLNLYCQILADSIERFT